MAILTPDYTNVNHDEMAAAIGLKPKHIPMLIGSFLGESDEILDKLFSAIESKDYTTIKEQAHAIKGSAGNLRFHEIFEMAKEMEFAGEECAEDFEYNAYFSAIKAAIGTIPN